MKTGNTSMQWYTLLRVEPPQWSPVMKTGNTGRLGTSFDNSTLPQWSPVMKTGNTQCHRHDRPAGVEASMEPGHEDREYVPRPAHLLLGQQASMEPGHEDREDQWCWRRGG